MSSPTDSKFLANWAQRVSRIIWTYVNWQGFLRAPAENRWQNLLAQTLPRIANAPCRLLHVPDNPGRLERLDKRARAAYALSGVLYLTAAGLTIRQALRPAPRPVVRDSSEVRGRPDPAFRLAALVAGILTTLFAPGAFGSEAEAAGTQLSPQLRTSIGVFMTVLGLVKARRQRRHPHAEESAMRYRFGALLVAMVQAGRGLWSLGKARMTAAQHAEARQKVLERGRLFTAEPPSRPPGEREERDGAVWTTVYTGERWIDAPIETVWEEIEKTTGWPQFRTEEDDGDFSHLPLSSTNRLRFVEPLRELRYDFTLLGARTSYTYRVRGEGERTHLEISVARGPVGALVYTWLGTNTYAYTAKISLDGIKRRAEERAKAG